MKGQQRFAAYAGFARCSRATLRGRRCRNAARYRALASGELVCATHRRAA